MRWRCAATVVALLLLPLPPATAQGQADGDRAAPTALALSPCRLEGLDHDALCGTLVRPLDPTRPQGTRFGLRSIVEGLLLDTMFDIPTETGIAEVVVDKDVVEGRKDPVRVLKGKEQAA